MEREALNAMWSSSDEGSTQSRHGHEEPDDLLVRILEGVPAGRALDLGCGLGANVVWLAERGWQAKGIDLSDVAVERARERAAAAGVDAVFEVGDLRSFVPEASYDLVTFFYVHLAADERRAALKCAASALAPGGRLVFVGHDRSTADVMAQHLREGHAHGHGRDHGHDRAHDHGHDHPCGHARDHQHGRGPRGALPGEDSVAALLSRLTAPEEIAGELPGLVVERAEVVQHDAHRSGELLGTTLVVARRL